MLTDTLRIVFVVCVLLEAGWMAFDGGRALVVGDYVTPQSGQYAGQLGPWSKVVSAVGIEPRGTLMKLVFFGYGIIWLAIAAAYLLGADWGWWAALVLAVGALWYLPFGTLLSVVQIVVLVALRAQVKPA